MRATLIATVAAICTAGPSLAQPVRTQSYDGPNPTNLVLQAGMVSNITFGIMEQIKRVMFGGEDGPVSTLKSNDTNQTPLINNLPLFGKKAGKTNFVVITLQQPEGKERPYLFNVTVLPAARDDEEKSPEATRSLTFTYPRGTAAGPQAFAAEAGAAVAPVVWRKPVAKPKDPEPTTGMCPEIGVQNWRYLGQGRLHDIAPLGAWDNGRCTAFRYPGNLALPAVFVVRDQQGGLSPACEGRKPTDNEAGEEVVQVTRNGDQVVIQRTAAHFRLRAGDQVMEIYNCGYDPVGQNPGTGTPSPDIIRRVMTTR